MHSCPYDRKTKKKVYFEFYYNKLKKKQNRSVFLKFIAKIDTYLCEYISMLHFVYA